MKTPSTLLLLLFAVIPVVAQENEPSAPINYGELKAYLEFWQEDEVYRIERQSWGFFSSTLIVDMGLQKHFITYKKRPDEILIPLAASVVATHYFGEELLGSDAPWGEKLLVKIFPGVAVAALTNAAVNGLWRTFFLPSWKKDFKRQDDGMYKALFVQVK